MDDQPDDLTEDSNLGRETSPFFMIAVLVVPLVIGLFAMWAAIAFYDASHRETMKVFGAVMFFLLGAANLYKLLTRNRKG